MYSLRNIVKDTILFIALVILISYAYKRLNAFLTLHRNSIIHELDHKFTQKLYTLQKQAHIVSDMIEQGIVEDLHRKIIDKIQKTVSYIEDKFSKNSPSLLFLGPIGTTSIVMKEKNLETKLLSCAKEIGIVLLDTAQNYGITDIVYQESEYLETVLKQNQQIITKIHHASRLGSSSKIA